MQVAGYLPNICPTIAQVGTSWGAGQYYRMQGPMLGENIDGPPLAFCVVPPVIVKANQQEESFLVKVDFFGSFLKRYFTY